MFEVIKNWIIVAYEFVAGLFLKETVLLKTWELLLVILLVVIAVCLLKLIFKGLKLLFKSLKKLAKKAFKSSKIKASELSCPKCSRRLDSCVCLDNQNLSMRKRIKKLKVKK